MMRFVHQSLTRSAVLGFCEALDSVTKTSVDVLFVYKKLAVVARIENGKERKLCEYHMETQLIAAFARQEFLFFFTDTMSLRIVRASEDYAAFEPMAALDTVPGLSRFTLSWDRKAACAVSDGGVCHVFHLDDPAEPVSDVFGIEGRLIMSVVRGKGEKTFVCLMVDDVGHLTMIEFDALTLEILSDKCVDRRIVDLLSSQDEAAREPLEIREAAVGSVNLPSRGVCFSERRDNFVIAVCEGNVMCVVNMKTKKHIIVSDIPDIRHVIVLQNGMFVCYGREPAIWIIRRPVANEGTEWNDFVVWSTERPVNFDRIGFYGANLVASSGQKVWKIGRSIEIKELGEVSEGGRIIAYAPGGVMETCGEKSRLISGPWPSVRENERTWAAFSFQKKRVQITSDGVWASGKREFDFERDVKYVTIGTGGRSAVIVMKSDDICVFKKGFTLAGKTGRLEGASSVISSIDISNGKLAISWFDRRVKISYIVLYTCDFSVIGRTENIPAKITTVRFGSDTTDLYAVCSNGALLRCEVKETENALAIAYIFFGEAIMLAAIRSYGVAFTSNGDMYVCANGKIVKTGIDQVTDMADGWTSLCFVREGRVLEVNASALGNELAVSLMDDERPFISVAHYGNYCVVLRHDEICITDSTSETEGRRIAVADARLAAVVLDYNNDMCIAIVSGAKTIAILRWPVTANDSRLTVAREFTDRIDDIHAYQGLFLFVTHGVILVGQLSAKGFHLLKTEAKVDGHITSIRVHGRYVWATVKPTSNSYEHDLLVLTLDRRGDRFWLCARRRFHSRIVLVTPIDDLTAAVCLDGGDLRIAEMQNSAAHGYVKVFNGAVPSLRDLLSCNVGDNIVGLILRDNALFYATEQGIIGSFVPITSRRDFDELKVFHDEAHIRYIESTGISGMALRSLSSVANIIDADVISAYSSLDDKEPIPFLTSAILFKALGCINL